MQWIGLSPFISNRKIPLLIVLSRALVIKFTFWVNVETINTYLTLRKFVSVVGGCCSLESFSCLDFGVTA